MKIITRDELLDKYQKKYPTILTDPVDRIKEYCHENNIDYEKAMEKSRKKLIDLAENIEYKNIRITMYEYPMKTDRTRISKYGAYSPNAKSNKKYLEKAVYDIYDILEFNINTPAEIDIEAYLEMPSNMKIEDIVLYELKLLKLITTPDYDNIGKCYTDMTTDTFTIDDDIFYRGQITKYYSLLPRIIMNIRYQTKHSSDYVFNKIKKRKSVKKLKEMDLIKLEKY